MNFSLETSDRINTPGIHTDITIESIDFADITIQNIDYRHIEIKFRTNAETPLYFIWNTASQLYGVKASIDELLATDAAGNFTYTTVSNGKVKTPATNIITALHKILINLSTEPKGKTDEVLNLIIQSANVTEMVANMQKYLQKYSNGRVQLKLIYSYHSRNSEGKVQRWLKEDKTYFVTPNDAQIPAYNERTDWVGKQEMFLEFFDPTAAVKAVTNGAGTYTPPGVPPGAQSFLPEADDLPFTTN